MNRLARSSERLLDFLQQSGGQIQISMLDLAEQLDLDPDTVRIAVKRLERQGFIRRKTGRGRQPNQYAVK